MISNDPIKFLRTINLLYFAVSIEATARKCSLSVLKNFAKFTGKHLCQSVFFNNAADSKPATLLKRKFLHRYSPVNFAKLWLLLYIWRHLLQKHILYLQWLLHMWDNLHQTYPVSTITAKWLPKLWNTWQNGIRLQH